MPRTTLPELSCAKGAALPRRLLVSLLAASTLFPAFRNLLSQQASPTHWTYSGQTGPDHWASLNPLNAACDKGKEESPIDLGGAHRAKLPPLRFDYHPATWQILDNGHSVQVNVPKGSSFTVDGHTYELIQFHFHHPSEESIRGKHFDMVVHLVHKDAEGHLAVIAVLLADGAPSPLIQALWDRIPAQQDVTETLEHALDATQLLPSTLGYYTFQGSLTTPPCTEGVRWFVMKTPLAISAAEEQDFAGMYPNNARPTQLRNGRTVSVSR